MWKSEGRKVQRSKKQTAGGKQRNAKREKMGGNKKTLYYSVFEIRSGKQRRKTRGHKVSRIFVTYPLLIHIVGLCGHHDGAISQPLCGPTETRDIPQASQET